MDEPLVGYRSAPAAGLEAEQIFRFENEWPIARTRWTNESEADQPEQNHDGSPRARLSDPVTDETVITYFCASPPSHAGTASAASSVNARLVYRAGTGVSFITAPLLEDTEITGPMALVLSGVQLVRGHGHLRHDQKHRTDGRHLGEAGTAGLRSGAGRQGRPRAAHRKLDPNKSVPYCPYHTHDERQWLKPGEVVECQVEIGRAAWCSSRASGIRLDIQPRDGVGASVYRHYPADYNCSQEGPSTAVSGSICCFPVTPWPK